MPNGAKLVKLIELGQEIKEFDVSEDPTVGGLFDQAEKDWPRNEISVTRNGSSVYEDTELYDGDRIFIGKKTKGNLDPFEVQFIRMGAGGGIHKLPAEDNDTIEKVLDQLDEDAKKTYYRADGSPAYEYRIGTQKVDGTYRLRRLDGTMPVRVILSQKIKGNQRG